MTPTVYNVIGIGLLCAVSIATRTLPFLFAEQLRSHEGIKRLGGQLPAVIMLLLVMFTLRDAPVVTYPYAVPEAVGLLTVIALQWRFSNTILSISVATLVYLIVSTLV